MSLLATPQGLTLAGVILARRHADGSFAVKGREPSIHAQLQAAYGRAIHPQVMRRIRRGCEWLAKVSDQELKNSAYPFHPNPHAKLTRGNEVSDLVMGLMMFALTGLNHLDDPVAARKRLLKMQGSLQPDALLKSYGLPTWEELMKDDGGNDHYSPDEPRIPAGQPGGGQWTTAGNGVANNNLVQGDAASLPNQSDEWTQAWIGQTHQDLREFIANSEQPNADEMDSYGYDNFHSSTDALGRYQLTPLALQDIGLKDADGNWTTDTAFYDTYLITSDSAFLQNEQAQEAAMTAYIARMEQLTTSAQQYIGITYKGVLGQPITVTMSGIIAAAQRAGGPAVNAYFGAYDGKNTFGLNLLPVDSAIETRIRLAQKIPY